MIRNTLTACLIVALPAAGCGRLDHVGKPPDFAPVARGDEYAAMARQPMTLGGDLLAGDRPASLWRGSRQSLLGDRRASQRGDIVTVVIEIDEKAEIANSTSRSRAGSESLAVPDFFGLPQRLNAQLPAGATTDPAVSVESSSSSNGDGSVRRNEKLTLRIAATVVDVLPNGHLKLQGTQEVRVNFELRELLVTGFVRPADISRQNEITYDKIASARISYGGRGQITDMQQPRIGQQISDILLPF